MKLLREIDRRGWITLALIAGGNVTLLIAGIAGEATFALIILTIIGFGYALILQLTRALLDDTLSLAQDTIKEWQTESDFARELVDDYVQTIEDLGRYDLQSSGIHLERLRAALIRRHPEMEDEILQVEHPLNMPGLVI